MASSSPTRSIQTKYSAHSESANLFKFLTGTFFQMPKPIQIIGWISFLLLFVYLVLYPMLGITYYEGKVVTISFDEQHKPHLAYAMGTVVTKGSKAVTNEQGEFTLGVHSPYIPFTYVDLSFTPPGATGSEDVSIPAPKPFVSLFNPNLRKIYYVPGSNVSDPSGLYVRHYFLNVTEARKALVDSGLSADGSPRRISPSGAGKAGRTGSVHVVEAATLNSPTTAYTLRFRELSIANIESAAEVYFEISVDGQSLRFQDLPDIDSSELRDLTVLAGSPTRFDALYIPVSKYAHRIDISVRERRSFLQRDPFIGTVHLDLTPDSIGKVIPLSGGAMELSIEVLPPAAIVCATVPGKEGKYMATVGLDVASDSLKYINRMEYDLGANFQMPHIGSPDIEPLNLYAHTISIFAAQPLKAKVEFRGGSTLNLATICTPSTPSASSPTEHYLFARAYADSGNQQVALQEVNKALQNNQDFVAAVSLRGRILAELGDYDGAASDYQHAITLAPDFPELLNYWAWMIADTIPRPEKAQLANAEKWAARAVKLNPDPNYYDTLGWVQFKLGKNEMALQTLVKAEVLQDAMNRNSSVLQGIEYHLAYVNKARGNRTEATRRFQEVTDFGKQHPSTSNDKYVQNSRTELAKIN